MSPVRRRLCLATAFLQIILCKISQKCHLLKLFMHQLTRKEESVEWSFLLFNILHASASGSGILQHQWYNFNDFFGEEEIINGGMRQQCRNVYEILYSVTVCGLSRVNWRKQARLSAKTTHTKMAFLSLFCVCVLLRSNGSLHAQEDTCRASSCVLPNEYLQFELSWKWWNFRYWAFLMIRTQIHILRHLNI